MLRSLAERIENRIAATEAVPTAAPTERENCTIAAPVPSRRGPETACTVTCTTPMTVPMNKAMTQNDQASCVGDISGARKAIATSPIVAAVRP